MAELKSEHVIETSGSVETVFRLLTDFSGYSGWLDASAAFEECRILDEGAMGLGTRFIDSGPAGELLGEVIEYEPPTRVGFRECMNLRVAIINIPIKVTIHYVIESTAGPTRVIRKYSMHAAGSFGFLIKLGGGKILKENERIMNALKIAADTA